MIDLSRWGTQIAAIAFGTARALRYGMLTTLAPAELAPIERAPLHVEALSLYAAVALGTPSALRPARVPS